MLNEPGLDECLTNFRQYQSRLFKRDVSYFRWGWTMAAVHFENPVVNYVSRSEPPRR